MIVITSKSQISELDTYMLNSVLGKKWYECECPNLMENRPLSKRFPIFWEKNVRGKTKSYRRYEERDGRMQSLLSKLYKWIYLKSLISENSEKKRLVVIIKMK